MHALISWSRYLHICITRTCIVSSLIDADRTRATICNPSQSRLHSRIRRVHVRSKNRVSDGIWPPVLLEINSKKLLMLPNPGASFLPNCFGELLVVIGSDENIDIALLKVDAETPLEFVEFGDSDISRVGDWVMAMGNPLGQGFSVSVGIISARNRELSGNYDDYIQTDAAINRGNSG